MKGVWDEWFAVEDMFSPKKRGRPKLDPTKCYSGSQLSEVHILYLEGWIDMTKREGECVNVKILQGLLREECNVDVPAHVIRTVLGRLGYIWGKAKKVGMSTRKSPDAEKLLHDYLVKYADALKKQATGEYVIVYMDESFLHQKHSANYTFFHPDSDSKNKVFCGTGKGQRLIIVHAISEDGLLSVPDEGRLEDDTWELKEEALTAEWVFVGKIRKADYHKNMNGDNFMKWVQKRLIPAFEAIYPDKKMILVLDNAPYHHCRKDDYIDVRNMKRKALFDELIITAQQKTIKIKRGGDLLEVDLVQHRKSVKGSASKPIPLNNELRAELQKYVDDHPETQNGKLFELFEAKQWELLWTPPYTPTLQPIELLWAFSKGRVAKQFDTKRSVQQTRLQYFEALYGTETREGYTSELCKSHIEHCHGWANKYIENDPKLSGTIDDLLEIEDVSSSSSSLPEDVDEIVSDDEDEEIFDNHDTFLGDVSLNDEEYESDDEIERKLDMEE